MTDEHTEGVLLTADDNAEVGAAALRRVDALEAAIKAITRETMGSVGEDIARRHADALVAGCWLPERVW